MIRQLRWKMIAAIMAMVTLIICGVCVIFYTMNRDNIDRTSHEMLMRAVTEEPVRVAGQDAPTFRDSPDHENVGLPYFLMITDADGNITETRGDSFQFAVQPTELVQAILDAPSDSGDLPQYNLRYLRQQTKDGWRLACHDLGFIQHVCQSLLITSALSGGGALVLFFLLSLLFTHWAIRPVEQAWNRQKQFIADASHEIKTPLTVILSNADMLSQQIADENTPAARRVDNIRAEGKRMRRLVESMLFLARSDASILTAPLQKTDWSDALETSALTFEPLVFEHGLTLESDIAPDCFVMSKPDDLRRLADILLDNAVKYALPGGQIRLHLTREAGRFALLTVSNPAVAMTSHQTEKLFDRFYRTDPARSIQNGYGLGLSIARSITQTAKGKIWMTYQDGIATFYVRLPLEKSSPSFTSF